MLNYQDIVMSSNDSIDSVDDFLMAQLTCLSSDESITAQEITTFKRSVVLGMTPEQMGHAATHIINFELAVCACSCLKIRICVAERL